MEFLHGLVVVVVAGAAVVAFGVSCLIFYFLVQKIWPIFIGGLGGYLIWKNFDTDLGVIFGLLLFVVQLWWWKRLRKDYIGPIKDPKSGNKKRYTEETYMPGYFDM